MFFNLIFIQLKTMLVKDTLYFKIFPVCLRIKFKMKQILRKQLLTIKGSNCVKEIKSNNTTYYSLIFYTNFCT